MLWVKSFHIVFIASWFAGLFYLPRIYVNLAMVPPESVAERERLLLMASKLFRFMTVLAVPALAWTIKGVGVSYLLWRSGVIPAPPLRFSPSKELSKDKIKEAAGKLQ
jgi:uncharacterized membrane protein